MTKFDILNKVEITNDVEAAIVISYHLLTQNEKSTSFSDCAYRGYDEEWNGGYDGKSCAIGCLIKDNFYYSSIEGNTVDYEEVIMAIKDSHGYWPINEVSINILHLFQHVHDHVDVDMWPIAIELLCGACVFNHYNARIAPSSGLISELRDAIREKNSDVSQLKNLKFPEIMSKRCGDLLLYSQETMRKGDILNNIRDSLLSTLTPFFESMVERKMEMSL